LYAILALRQMPWVLFVFGLLCATFAAISLRPPRWPGTVALAVWPIGWLIGELPIHHFAMWSAVGAGLVITGGLSDWPGYVGAGALALGLIGLRQHIVYAAAVDDAIERAFCEVDRCDRAHRYSWRNFAVVWPFRPRHVRRVANIEYANVKGRSLRLDVLRPDGAVGPGPDDVRDRPVFIYVHGGGWVIGHKNQQGRLTVHELVAAGWVCVSINYRLSPRATWPDHVVDVKRALAWVKQHIAEHGGDPSFIVIGGGSAGAHLASLTALSADDKTFQPGFEDLDLSVQGCVAYYGIYDFVDADRHFPYRAFQTVLLRHVVMKQPLTRARELYERASPVHHISTSAPPFLVWHGDRDTLAPVAGARAFVEKLRASSTAPCAYVELPGAQHAFELFPSLRSVPVVHGTHRFCQAIWSAHRARALTPADRH
jgi:acetyl esterase/lipase